MFRIAYHDNHTGKKQFLGDDFLVSPDEVDDLVNLLNSIEEIELDHRYKYWKVEVKDDRTNS